MFRLKRVKRENNRYQEVNGRGRKDVRVKSVMARVNHARVMSYGVEFGE